MVKVKSKGLLCYYKYHYKIIANKNRRYSRFLVACIIGGIQKAVESLIDRLSVSVERHDF